MLDGMQVSQVTVEGGKTRSFAIIHTWPELKNAEYEVIQRIAAAGVNLDAEVFVIDNDGYPLWASHRVVSASSPRITQKNCNFIISLHFESPKLIDLYSYVALWNPPSFYKIFGYQKSVEKLATHDDVLSCGSAVADAHASNLFEGFGRELLLPLPILYHSLPAPCLEPRIGKDARLFYIGINWERISGERGRHADLLESLDKADMIDIYGPEEIHGVEPWADFKNYRGSIPFDGRSILSVINKAGVCLAFSSEDHQKSGIMSTRLFEGLAAGAAIIANPHPIIDRHFSDCVYIVDDAKAPKERARDVQSILASIRSDPSDAMMRARLGQERFKQHFALEHSLEALFRVHADRAAMPTLAGSVPAVEVVVVYSGVDAGSLASMLRQAAGQRDVVVHLTVVCDTGLFESHKAALEASARAAASVKFVTDKLYTKPLEIFAKPRRSAPIGALVARALGEVRTEMFCLMGLNEHWFSNHLLLLARALNRHQEALTAVSGLIMEAAEDKGRSRRRLEELSLSDHKRILWAVEIASAGRFLFRSTLLPKIPDHLFSCLDGLEHRALALWAYLNGPLAQSGAASVVYAPEAEAKAVGFFDESLQVDMILDSVRNDVAWSRHALPAAPSSPSRSAPRLEPDMPYAIVKGEDGHLLLAAGFSSPESDWTWIDGRSATMKFALPEDVDVSRQVLVLTLGGRKSVRTGADQVCTIKVNRRIALDRKVIREARQRVTLPLADSKSLNDGDDVVITFQLQHADYVYDKRGRILDPRHLGLWLSELELKTTTTTNIAPALTADHAYNLTKGGDGTKLMVFGFSHQEKDRTWIDGLTARLRFRLPRDVPVADQTLFLKVGSRPSNAGEPQTCMLRINGQVLAEGVAVDEPVQVINFSLAEREDLTPNAEINLDVELFHADQVVDKAGTVVDTRYLGLWLSELEIKVTEALVLVADHAYTLAKDGNGTNLMVFGFSHPEEDRTWIDGLKGRLRFRLPPNVPIADQTLLLKVGSRPSNAGRSQTCTLRINDQVLAEALVMDQAVHFLNLPLTACEGLAPNAEITLDVELSHADHVLDQAGNVVDARHLGLWLSELEIKTTEEPALTDNH